MIAGPFRPSTHPLSRFIGYSALLFLGGLTARAQETTAPQPAASPRTASPQSSDQLQQQLQELKQQYDATTRDLEHRIAALEQRIEREKEQEKEEKEAREKARQGTVSAAESPVKARLLESASYRIAPNEKMSLRASAGRPRTCSGDM